MAIRPIATYVCGIPAPCWLRRAGRRDATNRVHTHSGSCLGTETSLETGLLFCNGRRDAERALPNCNGMHRRNLWRPLAIAPTSIGSGNVDCGIEQHSPAASVRRANCAKPRPRFARAGTRSFKLRRCPPRPRIQTLWRPQERRRSCLIETSRRRRLWRAACERNNRRPVATSVG